MCVHDVLILIFINSTVLQAHGHDKHQQERVCVHVFVCVQQRYKAIEECAFTL